MQPITLEILDIFHRNKSPANAGPMSAYMKNLFPFLGINNPQRKLLLKPISKLTKTLDEPELHLLINELYFQDEREFQYAAIDLLNENINRLSNNWRSIAGYLPLIREKSWWDSVDSLRKPLGIWAKRNVETGLPLMMNYLLPSENMWDRRVAITLQLQWKEKTQTQWLEKAIEDNQNDHQFFIQKGIGWALREYSKTDKNWVIAFLNSHSHQLSALAVRESSKYLPKD